MRRYDPVEGLVSEWKLKCSPESVGMQNILIKEDSVQ